MRDFIMAKPERQAWLTCLCFGALFAVSLSVGQSGIPMLCLLCAGSLIAFLAPSQQAGIVLLCASMNVFYTKCPPNDLTIPLISIAAVLMAAFGIGVRLAWVPVIALALPLTYFSGGAGGAGGWAEYLMGHFGLTFQQADFAVLALRKTIHFSYYGLIGLSAWFALREEVRRLMMALILVLGVSCFDEVRQTFTPGRTGKIEDVLIDLAGAAVCVILIERWSQRRNTPSG
ncbi:MAG: VanZ family protein [Armatimonadetes bacterium]|nr:VanZ family protein [Armatimonadota bacterium]